jgi:hypothetical protein
MASLLPLGCLSLDDARSVLLGPTTWRITADLNAKAKDDAVTYTADSVFPPELAEYNPVTRLALLLTASSTLSLKPNGAVISLTLVNLFNALPPRPASDSPAFTGTFFDFPFPASLTDNSFSELLTSICDSLDLSEAELAALKRPFLTAANVLGTAAISEKILDYSGYVFGVWCELAGAQPLPTDIYSREQSPLYLSLAAQSLSEKLVDSKPSRKTARPPFSRFPPSWLPFST